VVRVQCDGPGGCVRCDGHDERTDHNGSRADSCHNGC
jgi:hypothetical protein